MSYASVASNNAPPPSQQPHADTSLLTTRNDQPSSVADDQSKLNVVPPDFKEHVETTTGEIGKEIKSKMPADDYSNSNEARKQKAQKKFDQAEEEGIYLWEVTKSYLFRPGVAGGLLGIVNVGLLAGVSRAFYVNPHYRQDYKVIGTTAAATLAILGAEGFIADSYAQTEAGQQEAQRAKEEGSYLYKHTREAVLRPGTLGGLVGLLNAGILGTVGYYGYQNWDKPTWDRTTVSAVTVGLLALWGGEGVLAEKYRKEH